LSVPATVSSLGLAACALLLALITAVRGALRAPFVWHWGLLALIFLYLAVDEGASLHEILHANLGDTSIAQGYFERTWVIFGIAGVALRGLAYIPFLRHLPRRYALGMIICGAMYTGGALGFEMLGANASEQGAAVSYHVFATLEEMLEISGIAAFLVVLWSYLRRLPWSLGSPGSAR